MSSICRKSYFLLYRLNFFRKSTNFNLRKHLVQTLLSPIVDYCSLVWCDLSPELNQKLEVSMNAGKRYIYGIRKREHSTPFKSSLQWLTISFLYSNLRAFGIPCHFTSENARLLVFSKDVFTHTSFQWRSGRPLCCRRIYKGLGY